MLFWDFFLIKNYFNSYILILLIIYFFSSFSFSFLLNIEMEINYHSNLMFIYASKQKNYNYQIHSYSRGNKNKNKIFILVPHSHIINMSLIVIHRFSFRWYLFFGWIKKTKIFGFCYSTKSNMMISTNITKMNLLSICSI